jgi:hypothetical protein
MVNLKTAVALGLTVGPVNDAHVNSIEKLRVSRARR